VVNWVAAGEPIAAEAAAQMTETMQAILAKLGFSMLPTFPTWSHMEVNDLRVVVSSLESSLNRRVQKFPKGSVTGRIVSNGAGILLPFNQNSQSYQHFPCGCDRAEIDAVSLIFPFSLTCLGSIPLNVHDWLRLITQRIRDRPAKGTSLGVKLGVS